MAIGLYDNSKVYNIKNNHFYQYMKFYFPKQKRQIEINAPKFHKNFALQIVRYQKATWIFCSVKII